MNKTVSASQDNKQEILTENYIVACLIILTSELVSKLVKTIPVHFLKFFGSELQFLVSVEPIEISIKCQENVLELFKLW